MLLLLILTLFLGTSGTIVLLFIWRGWTVERLTARCWRWWFLHVLSKQNQLRILDCDASNAHGVQEKLLLKALRGLQDTEYGKKHHFKDVADISSFKRLHPLTHYSHYKDYIQQMAQGEQNILVTGGPLALVATTGTSGLSSLVPVKASSATERFIQGTSVCLQVIQKSFPGALEKVTKFTFPPNQINSHAGIPIGSYPCATSASFLEYLYSPSPPHHPTMSHHEVLYTQILYALRDRGLMVLEANLAWHLREVFSFMETYWGSLVTDIEMGYLNPDLKLPQDTRREIEDYLLPDVGRAAELRAQFEKGFVGIAKRIWPQLQVVVAVGSGANELDLQILKDTACQGILIYSPMYYAVEGLIGVNLWPENIDPRYVMCPRSAFFEFIPLTTVKEEEPDTVCMKDVIIGEAYELVITNTDGLCRYRLGDVVRVTALHNQSPVLEFLHRKSQTLSVRGERISEDEFYRALLHTVNIWPGATLVNYCCIESGILGPFLGGSDPHYEVFIALKGVRDLSEEQRNKLDQALQDRFPIYKSFRFKGSIGPVRVHLVSHQSFFKLHVLASCISGAPLDCIQPPRTLRHRRLAECIQKQVVS
ncbi:GH3 domain-containing protein [Spea bombifrons]|uniref:GH3 domain-containing protein n=1 Tax=Spea bombifrons TaxID=233779 RepID=UPI00234B5D09|nr:GH3 domain-containing protein [Spea bombifrons]